MTSVAPEASASLESVGKKAKKGDSTHFGGPWGARVLLVFLPLVSLYLWICIHRHEGALVVPDRSVFAAIPVPTPRSALLLLGWVGFQALLDVALPGKVVTGLAQRDGVKMQYRLNGFLSLIVTLAVGGGLYAAGLLRGAVVLEELGPLLSSAILFAFLFSLFLYFYGFTSTREEERTDLAVYDYFMGTALNPRLGKLFDLKLFFESKIGMTTWIVLSLAMAAAQFERDGSVSTEMILVCLFQLWYVADFYWFEDAMLTTWDINYENYGFMLVHAFLVWMPFNFTLQQQYLLVSPSSLPAWAAVLLVLMNLAGYVVFRDSNLQKQRFRRDPTRPVWGKPPKTLKTRRGTELLLSGWWGLARHTNYLGDLTMALSWCLACGFGSIVPYFYFLYFAPLLLDRERRDHKLCKEKYGDDWDEYCRLVPYRICPWLY